MITLSDDRLDLELVGFLRDEAEDLYGAPDARGMAQRLGSGQGSLRRRLEQLLSRPTVRLAIVGLLLAAALGATLVVGSFRSGEIRNGLLLVGPGVVFDPATDSYSNLLSCGVWCSEASPASWSPDGHRQAMVDMNGLEGELRTGRDGWSIWVFDDRSGDLTPVAMCPSGGFCSLPVFSLDGGSIAYIESATPMPDSPGVPLDPWRIVALDLRTQDRRAIEMSHDLPQRIAWTADGKVLANVQSMTNAYERRSLLFDLDAQTVDALFTQWQFVNVGLAPNGRSVALQVYAKPIVTTGIVRAQDRLFELWLADIDGTGLRRVFQGPGVSIELQPVWSPDGRQVAFVVHEIGRQGRVFSVNVETGDVGPLENTPESIYGWLPAA